MSALGVPRDCNPVICGRKFCTHCGRWRIVPDFRCVIDRRCARGYRLDSFCVACRRRVQREYYRQQTPSQRAKRREDAAFYRDRLRRARGADANYRPRGRKPVDCKETVKKDPAPLLAVIDAHIREYGESEHQLAARAGVPPRAIYRMRYGESRRIQLDTADKFAVALGLPLALIYPE